MNLEIRRAAKSRIVNQVIQKYTQKMTYYAGNNNNFMQVANTRISHSNAFPIWDGAGNDSGSFSLTGGITDNDGLLECRRVAAIDVVEFLGWIPTMSTEDPQQTYLFFKTYNYFIELFF